MGSTQPMIVMHPKYIDEIKNHPDLSFTDAIKRNFFDDRISGFEPFHGGSSMKVTVDVVRTKLTQALGMSNTLGPLETRQNQLTPLAGSLTVTLSTKTSSTLEEALPPTDEWTPYNFAHKAPYMIARLSSLIFMGETVSRNAEWIDVSVHYAIDAFVAMRELRNWPSVLRPIVHWFLPCTRKLRSHLSKAQSIINNETKKRSLIREGKLPKDPSHKPDALDWLHDTAEAQQNREFNQDRAQVGLALAAIHTTSNLLTNIMYDLAAYPEYIQPLRDEICAVAAADGVLNKASLLKFKLMDSIMKESQRTHPVSLVSLNRLVQRKIVLSDGTVLPKGANVAVSTRPLEDDDVYPNAATYDGYRFLKKRQEPGNEHKHQFVTTTTEHFVFGHGVHACPGRFFAAMETKILLLHLVMKYDFKLQSEGRPKNFENGFESITDPTIELLFRSRQPEVDLSFFGE
ncbi:unnamed protein product [Penicillium salamii]|nr:unnamed protein product [Penicillium salamii]